MPQLKPVTIDSTYGQPASQTVSIILSAIHLAVGELGQSHSRIIADPHNVCLNRLVTSFQLILRGNFKPQQQRQQQQLLLSNRK